MMVFWIVAVLLLAAALLFLVPPLTSRNATELLLDRDEINVELYKDQLAELQSDLDSGVLSQDQFAQAKQDLERSLLEDIGGGQETAKVESGQWKGLRQNSALVVGLFVPVLAIVMYSQLGGGELAFKPEEARKNVQAEGHQGNIQEQVRQLQEHLQANPDDLEGWTMLARSYYFMKQYQAASDAFARSVALSGNSDPNLLADYADALAMANGRTMAGQPYEMVKKALVLQPKHQKSLWLAATAALEAQDYPTSLGYWNRLLQMFPEGTQNYNQMLRNIAEVKQRMGQELEPELVAKMQKAQQQEQQGANTGQAQQSNASGLSVSGQVTLDASLTDKASPGDTLFVFARAANGPRMPLAIIKTTVADLPLQFKLDDSMAMDPSMTISKYSEIVVAARITKSKDAMPKPGDLLGTTPVIKTGSTGINLVIKNIVPENPTAQAPARTSPATSQTASMAGVKVAGTISLDPALNGKVAPNDTVFVFARAVNGPRMPLAIIRKQVKDLPMQFSLDDSLAMRPDMRLSKYAEVIVAARISKTGDAIPKSGDLKGSSSVIKVGREDLKIIIDSAVP